MEENNNPTFTFEMLMEAFKETREQINELKEAQRVSAEEWKEVQRASAEEWKEAQRASAEEWKEWKEARRISAEEWKEWKEARRISAEKSEKEWAEIKEAQKRTDKQIGAIANSNGRMAEQMVFNSLERKMTLAGIKFNRIELNKNGHNKELNLKGEYDIVMTNHTTVALIEAKHNVNKNDVYNLAKEEVIENFRLLFPEYKNYKIMLAIGGASFEKNVEKEAKENGIGVIKVVGDKVEYYTEGIRIY